MSFLLVAPAWAQLVVAQAPAAATPPVQQNAIPPQEGTRPMQPRETAVLQVLDKISARTTTLRVPFGSSAAFGLIVMAVRTCQAAPPGETPESAAFLEISEIDVNSLPRNGGAVPSSVTPVTKLLFSGWMFASSPALSALEHPTYDVTLMSCESKEAPPAPVAAPVPSGTATDTPAAPPED